MPGTVSFPFRRYYIINDPAAPLRPAEKVASLRRCGFFEFAYYQTLTMHPIRSNCFVEEPSEGFDRSSYVAIVARRVPFLEQLKDGTLPRSVFARYVFQDALYLRRHAEALVELAGKPDREEDRLLFENYAQAGVDAERQMLGEYVKDAGASDEGWGYETLELVRRSPAAVGVAAVYPCFRMYADAGLWLRGCVGPYAKWVSPYAGPEFVAEADKVEAVRKRLAWENPELQPEMENAVADGMKLELEYWKV